MVKNTRSDAALANELRAGLSHRIARLVGPVEKRTTEVPGLTIVCRVRPTVPTCVTYEPNLAVITQGRKEVVLGGRTIRYDESRYLLTSVDLPIVSHIPEASAARPFVGLSLKLDLAMVRGLLSVTEPARPGRTAESPAMATAPTTIEILDACRRLVDLVDHPREIAVLSGLIQREIVFRVLQGPLGARLRAIATLGDQSHRTARAIDWIRQHFAEPLRVEELARMTGMAVSTLHHRFRALTSMSPLQYQKQLRLQAARGRMLTEGLDAASAAFEVGYQSASQFNREYRRLFGLPPMADMQTLRASSQS
ncbi:MAG: AraC family transcriptional regulator [Bryobacterales bacterium]|nr:AraC family transcriptional regulator [Bryobacterales bacterium]